MSRRKKLTAAACVLMIGVGSALLFPKVAPEDNAVSRASGGGDLAGASDGSSPRDSVPGRSRALSMPPLRGLGIPVRSTRIPPAAGPRHDVAGHTAGESQPTPLQPVRDRLPPELPPEFTAALEPGSPLRPIYRTVDELAEDDDDERSPYEERLHRVRKRDTLRLLAKWYLQSPSRYWEIYELNRDRLPDGPEPLPIGTDLRIPPLAARPPKSSQPTASQPNEGSVLSPRRLAPASTLGLVPVRGPSG